MKKEELEKDICRFCKYKETSVLEEPCNGCKWIAGDNFKLAKVPEEMPKLTNADRIRSMSDEELSSIIMCPYDTADTAGSPADIRPCIKDGSVQELISLENCEKCTLEWLQKGVDETDESSTTNLI